MVLGAILLHECKVIDYLVPSLSHKILMIYYRFQIICSDCLFKNNYPTNLKTICFKPVYTIYCMLIKWLQFIYYLEHHFILRSSINKFLFKLDESNLVFGQSINTKISMVHCFINANLTDPVPGQLEKCNVK